MLHRRIVPFAVITAAASLILAANPAAQSSVSLETGWKFIKGDNPAYADPAFDDSGWSPIRVDRIWEEQGNDPYDGYAWYRIRVIIPSTIRDEARLKAGLRIALGKINNFDLSFLNGRLFGRNGKVVAPGTAADDDYIKEDKTLYDLLRTYILSFDDPRILWDRENVIAVRVFDEGGQGGMFAGEHGLRAVGFRDYITCDYKTAPFVFAPAEVEKTVTIRNTSSTLSFQGTLSILAVAPLDGSQIRKSEYPVDLEPGRKKEFSIRLPKLEETLTVTYTIVSPGDDDRWEYREGAPYILTPAPPDSPRLTGPKIVGARPGRPFQHILTATGRQPMTFAASSLPRGLDLNPRTGIITGRPAKKGDYKVEVIATNAAGEDRRTIKIVIGPDIALTPQMGWNSWNVWGTAVDAEKVKASAQAFVDTGLRDHGWTYINIDDGWEIQRDDPRPKRDPDGKIITNEKFPDMQALADSVHALGLKFGLYSSPGPWTCAGYAGSYEHEAKDAGTYADWGVDYLKYDWCSYDEIAINSTLYQMKRPYLTMRKALDAVDRDIFFSLCQYGMGKVWEWGAEVGGNSWRTTGDITDTWESIRDIGFAQTANAKYAGPGHWNDPDMLVVGWVGWGPNLRPTGLTPDEQYTHISLWSLLAAPLLIGCDLTRLDAFTLNLLTNDEVLAVNQDPLGKQAVPSLTSGDIQIWTKELEDGSTAAGVFNLGEKTASYTLEYRSIGLKGMTRARDLWRQKELTTNGSTLDMRIPSHGVMLLRLYK